MTTVGRAVLEIVTDQKGLDAGLNSNLSSIKKFSISASGALSSLGVGLGAGAVVAGVKSIVTSVLGYAGEIDDLASKMSVSMDATQRWKFAAEQTGASLEDVSKSVMKLSTNLDGGGASIKQSLKAAGLEFTAIRAMKPEDAFNAVVAAVAKIPDPMTQSRVALELLGKSGLELLPAMRQNFAGLAAAAKTMSDDTIRDLAAAEDEIAKFTNDMKISAGAVAAAITRIRTESKLTSEFRYAPDATMAKASAAAYEDLAGMVSSAGAALRNRFIPPIGSATAEMARLTPEFDKQRDAVNKAVAAQDAYNKKIGDLASKLTGKTLAQEVSDLAAAVAKAGKDGGISAFEYAELGKQLDDLKAKGAVLPPELQNIWLAHEKLNPSIKTTTADYAGLAAMIKSLPTPKIGPLVPPPPISIPVNVGPINVTQIGQQLGALPAPPQAITLGQRIGAAISQGLKSSLWQVADIIGGALMAWQSGSKVDPVQIGQQIGGSIGSGIGGAFAGPVGAKIGQVLGGLVGGTIGKVFSSAGRDAVKEFANSMGGFDALRAKLNVLGDEGERLWITLTQGVGKNNPQQAAAAIKAIEDALAKAEKEAVDTQNEIIRLTAEIADLERQAVPSLDDMRQAAEFFGIEISSLGAAFQQQQLTATATEIWNAFEALRLSGTDMNVILTGASGKFSKLVQDSLKFGTAIPSNMKPVIQSLIDQGLLLDENGEKITDISQIKFGDPVKSEWEIIGEAIDKLTKALDDLIKKLEKGVVGAADKARRAFEDWEIPDVPTPGGPGGSGSGRGGSGGGTSPAAFGFSSFGGATFAMPRVRVPASAGFSGFAAAGMSSAFTSNSQRPIIIQHTTNLDGKKVARNQAKYLPGEGLRAIGGVT